VPPSTSAAATSTYFPPTDTSAAPTGTSTDKYYYRARDLQVWRRVAEAAQALGEYSARPCCHYLLDQWRQGRIRKG
jgi:hypothetical protein